MIIKQVVFWPHNTTIGKKRKMWRGSGWVVYSYKKKTGNKKDKKEIKIIQPLTEELYTEDLPLHK